jgi:hypothetical protein
VQFSVAVDFRFRILGIINNRHEFFYYTPEIK